MNFGADPVALLEAHERGLGGMPEAEFSEWVERLTLALKPGTKIPHRAKAGEPLHFAIDGDEQHEYIPYWQVALDQTFTCDPTMNA